jgi:hypothetical protein
MTRSGKHASAIARFVACAFATACVRAGGAVEPAGPPDLSNLEFVPSLPGAATAEVASPAREADTLGVDAERTGRTMVRLAQSIQAEQSVEGAFSPGLIYDMISLASLYQQIDDHVGAIAVLDRAKQIVRVNNGLSSLDQAEMLQRTIVSLEAMGRYGTAALQRNELLALARKHPTDLRAGAIFADVADGRFAAIERWLDAEMKVLPVIYGATPTGRDNLFPSVTALVRSGIASAQQIYGDAIRATVLNGSPGGPDLPEIEASLMRTYWLQADHMRLFFDSNTTKYEIRQSLDDIGAKSYERRLKFIEALHRPPLETASALVELGDWHLIFRNDVEADAAYRRALETLKSAGGSAGQFDALFTPSPEPMLVPAFAPHFIGATQALGFTGYFDVVVDLNTFGRSENVRITSSSSAMTSPTMNLIAKRLKKHIAKTEQFRPRFVNGERAAHDDVALRYYFTY